MVDGSRKSLYDVISAKHIALRVKNLAYQDVCVFPALSNSDSVFPSPTNFDDDEDTTNNTEQRTRRHTRRNRVQSVSLLCCSAVSHQRDTADLSGTSSLVSELIPV